MRQKQAVRAIVIKDGSLLTMRRDKFGMQYHTLIGGGVDVGEDQETALRRELFEETGMKVGAIRWVFTEDGGDLYGVQYVYLCEYVGGDPRLDPSSEEAAISALGKNIYEPVWLPLNKVMSVTFRSSSVRDALLAALKEGFPDQPQTLAWKA
jgi:ADP-ribose pyrophosphatase YjhB (NUDIX family)